MNRAALLPLAVFLAVLAFRADAQNLPGTPLVSGSSSVLDAITTADVTNSTATQADITGLTMTVPAGTWDCESFAVVADSVGAEGAIYALSFAGTSTTATGGVTMISDAGAASGGSCATAPTTCGLAVATFLLGTARAHWTGVVTVAGILKARVAQNTHNSGTVTVSKGATLMCRAL